ncbi:MAG: efflux RND transporter periplasmic adaptor subunit [Aquimonas sp.]|nr:efflux RND transporter periplasmic adaptor subunit [Aquimonas sp.]
MRETLLPTAAAAVLALSLAACGSSEPLSPKQAVTPPIEFFEAQLQPAARERVWDGVVEAVNAATLSAQTGGRVLELPFDVNDYVRAGEVVVRFTDVEQQSGQRQAQAALTAARAAADEAAAEFGRISEVYERRLVSRAQFDQASARRDATRAQLQAAEAAVKAASERVDYTVVRAPYSGIVTQRFVEIGETVGPGQPLIAGLSLDRLRLAVQVPQSDVQAIRAQGRAALVLEDGRRVEAERVVVFPYADPSTHSFSVRVELPEAETGLAPGMAAKVAFVVGESSRLLLPRASLVRRGEVAGAYVLGPTGLVLRQLRLGHASGDQVEVLSGLAAGERVALDPVAAGLWLEQQRRGGGNG